MFINFGNMLLNKNKIEKVQLINILPNILLEKKDGDRIPFAVIYINGEKHRLEIEVEKKCYYKSEEEWLKEIKSTISSYQYGLVDKLGGNKKENFFGYVRVNEVL